MPVDRTAATPAGVTTAAAIRVGAVVGLVSAATLSLELALVKIFDAALSPSYGYLVLTCALFSIGLAGVYGALRPGAAADGAATARRCVLFAAACALQVFVLDAIPFDVAGMFDRPVVHGLWFALVLATTGVPFFAFGRIVATIIAARPAQAARLYAASLGGSALGCVVPLPLIPAVGPGGVTLCCAALCLLAAAVATPTPGPTRARARAWRAAAGAVAVLAAAVPFALGPLPFEVREYVDKQAVRTFRDRGLVELTRWDPVSKIDVISIEGPDRQTGAVREHYKFVAYDGGSQTTRFTPFDGDLAELRRQLRDRPEVTSDYFWQRGLLAPHWLKRDRGADVLVIGAGGGQDVLAALLYGARRVDAVEMVAAVVELATERYAAYTGGILRHPAVRVHVDEGRSFLRATERRYDVVQIFSNHTSSTAGAGTGAFEPDYLLTAEAYRGYFEHLKPDGVLHVSHHGYPRLITTAALAWHRMGRSGFRAHVLVFERDLEEDMLPVLLVKMSPWTAAEIEDLQELFEGRGWLENYRYRIAEHPLRPRAGLLSDDFYTGQLPARLVEAAPVRITPCTDDRPYFNFLRTRFATLDPEREPHLDRTTARYLNNRLLGGSVPSELLHLLLPALLGTLLAVAAVVAARAVGRLRASFTAAPFVYFASIGAGFIGIELVLVQLLIKPIGFPHHAYAVVLFALLAGAGLGSLAAGRLAYAGRGCWALAFVGVGATAALFQWVCDDVSELVLGAALPLRVVGAVALVLPLGFFLGMPFPLGILALARARAQPSSGAVALAWGVNSVFTVLGGVAAAALTMGIGFRATLWAVALLYVPAAFALARLRATSANA